MKITQLYFFPWISNKLKLELLNTIIEYVKETRMLQKAHCKTVGESLTFKCRFFWSWKKKVLQGLVGFTPECRTDTTRSKNTLQ